LRGAGGQGFLGKTERERKREKEIEIYFTDFDGLSSLFLKLLLLLN
jgi:hypothetical protein